MCGLFCLIGAPSIDEGVASYFERLKLRGPETTHIQRVNDCLLFGFYRLAIVGLDTISDQPMEVAGNWLVCNGEIYNYKALIKKYNFAYKTHSDCEVILHLYNAFGIERTIRELDGEFAFVLHDTKSGETYAGRDHLGVRPLYIGRKKQHEDETIFLASEAKALIFCDSINQFPPGHSWKKSTDLFQRYISFDVAINASITEKEACQNIRHLLIKAIEKRMAADREIGFLLSGGLDSSLVVGIAANYFVKNKNFDTFSIGLKGSPDLEKAQQVADFIGSRHHSVACEEKQFLQAIEQVIYTLGSYDVTTIRASVGHYLISHWVSKHTTIKVLLSGETADEVAGGYLYFQNAPSLKDFHQESIRLLSNIHFFDMQRGDRSISSAGLEGRMPFSDKFFIQYYLSIPTALKRFDEKRIEKYLIRKAFEGDGIIPEDILWRRKNAFSDSVSSINRSWSDIINEYVEAQITDQDYRAGKGAFAFNPPQTKEAYFYRKIFTRHYGHHQHLTPYQWLPKWSGNILDPSARKLTKIYKAD